MKKVISSILVVAMLLTFIPVAFAANDVTFKIGDGTYTVKPGEEFEVPVTVAAANGEAIKKNLIQITVGIPEGFSATVKSGTFDADNDITVYDTGIIAYNDSNSTIANTDVLFTIVYKAPVKEGTYTLDLAEGEDQMIYAEVDGVKNKELTLDVAKSTVTVKSETTPTVTLESIKVEPSELTVPYANQTDIESYVKSNIKVTAIYSDSSEKEITDYTIKVDGTTATVAYEGKVANVALKLESKPTTDKDVTFKLGVGSYTVKPGEEFEVPVTVAAANGEPIKKNLIQITVGIPEGFSATVKNGIFDAENDITVYDAGIIAYNDSNSTIASTDVLFTIVYKAPDKEGTYTLDFAEGEDQMIYAEVDGVKNKELTLDVAKSTVTVTGGSTPTKALDSITVSPDTVTIPYGADAEETIKNAITVKAIYSDTTDEVVTDYELEIGDTTATVKYTVDGVTKTADVKLVREAAPVLTVENTKVTVPYGTTADVDFITKAIGAVKLNDTTLTTDKYTVTYNSGDATATVKYNDDDKVAAVTIDVNYVVLTTVEIALKSGVEKVELPWDIESGKEADYIKSCIVVTAKFSDSTTKELAAADYDVMYDADKGEFYVEFNGLQSTAMTVTKGVKPAAQLTEITVNPTEVVVPYGTEDAKLGDVIRNAVVVTAKYDDGTESAVSEYSIFVGSDDKATITYDDKTAEVALVYETRELVLDKTEITLDEGVTKDDVIKYVKDTVKVSFKYSDKTEEKVLADGEYEVTVNDELNLVTVTADGETKTITVKYNAKLDYVKTVVKAYDAYGVSDAALVVFTGVKDGKLLKISDRSGEYNATYMGNGKWAAVVTGSYTIEVVDGALPAAAKFGHLHDADRVTAYDALLTLLKANNNAVKTFDDNYQMYLLADVDGNGEITADEALYINKISLGIADDSLLWFNK